MKKKLLFASKLNPHHCMIVFAPYPLGETRVQREAEALVRSGYDVDIICLRLPGESIIDFYKGVRIFRLKYRLPRGLLKGGGLTEKFLKYLRFFFSAGIQVTKLFFQIKYATIQVHNLPDFLVFCTMVPKLFGASIILDLHDLMPEFYAGRFGQTSSFSARLILKQEQLSCRFADHVITVSEHWRQALIKRGLPPNKCSVIMNVADDQIFRKLISNQSHIKPQNQFRLIYHGTFVERYGLDLVIKAIDLVRNEIPGIHLLLVGDGTYLPEIEALVKKFNLYDYVTIKPLQLAENLPAMIHSCNLGVVPYRNDVFTDGLIPTKLLEYASMGLPVIASRTTAISAYFGDANVEFFTPGDVNDLANRILYLFHNPKQMSELAHRSENFNKIYNWDQISKEYVSLIDCLRVNNPEPNGPTP